MGARDCIQQAFDLRSAQLDTLSIYDARMQNAILNDRYAVLAASIVDVAANLGIRHGRPINTRSQYALVDSFRKQKSENDRNQQRKGRQDSAHHNDDCDDSTPTHD